MWLLVRISYPSPPPFMLPTRRATMKPCQNPRPTNFQGIDRTRLDQKSLRGLSHGVMSNPIIVSDELMIPSLILICKCHIIRGFYPRTLRWATYKTHHIRLAGDTEKPHISTRPPRISVAERQSSKLSHPRTGQTRGQWQVANTIAYRRQEKISTFLTLRPRG